MKINKIQSIEKPSAIHKLGNNTYYYNHKIMPCKIVESNTEGESKEVDGYEYYPIYIQGQPCYNQIVLHTIRAYLTLDEEFDLINSYNKSIMLGDKTSKNITDYKGYLQLLENIKSEVKQNINF